MFYFDTTDLIEGGGTSADGSPRDDFNSQIASDLAVMRQILEEQQEKERLKEEEERVQEEAQEDPQEEEEEQQEEPPVIDLTLLSPADNNLYLSSEVQYANINDVYSIMLSTRNILLLFLFVFLFFKVGAMFRSVLARLMNR